MNVGSDLLKDLLKSVSRSFYLSLRVLPRSVRKPIGLAYLLPRASDTITDTEILPVEERVTALRSFGDRIAGETEIPLDLKPVASHQGDPAENRLLVRIPEALALLEDCNAFDQKCIRKVLETIISGQELDLTRFRLADETHVVALETEEELDDYTFRVAGCVGLFWTEVCNHYLWKDSLIENETVYQNAMAFGKGLQLVNILRDIPGDLKNGRCYLPQSLLSEYRLNPEDLLNSSSWGDFKELYFLLLDRAESKLERGWEYTLAIPPRPRRVRLACSWPLLIGVRTLKLLRITEVMDQCSPVRVPRKEVRRILAATIVRLPIQKHWNTLFRDYQ